MIHQLLARGFALDGSIEHLLSTLTLSGTVNKTERTLPPCAIILNRNPNFTKGVNKILKMIAALVAQDPQTGANFMSQHLPVGCLTSHNVISLFKFITRIANSGAAEAQNYKSLVENLVAKRFFLNHLENVSTRQQKIAFKNALEATR